MNTVKIFIENQNRLLGSKEGGVTVHSAVKTSQYTVAKKLGFHIKIHACKPKNVTMVSLTNLFYAFNPILASIGQKLYVFVHHFQLGYECTNEDVPITKIMFCKWVD